MHAAISTTAPGQFTPAMIAEILRYVSPQPPYEKWILVVSAVASVLPEQEAVAVLTTWSPEKQKGEYSLKIRHRLTKVGIGSLINVAKEHGFDARAFFRKVHQQAHPSYQQSGPAPQPSQPTARAAPAPKRPPPPLRQGTGRELAALAALRGLPSDAGLAAMQAAGCLAFTDGLRDQIPGGGWGSLTAWIVLDPTRRNLSARRLDGEGWNCLGRRKAWCLSGPGSKGWPVGITLALPGQRLDVVEGDGDFLSLWHLHTELSVRDACPVGLLGSCTNFAGFSAELHRHIHGRTVQLFAHQDENGAGQKAAAKWAREFYTLGATEVRIKDLRAWLHGRGKDLNDVLARLAKAQSPDGLCPACLARNIVAPANGPTCRCDPYTWPDFAAQPAHPPPSNP